MPETWFSGRRCNGTPGPQDVLFKELGERIRGVRVGPDGSVYLLTMVRAVVSVEARVIALSPHPERLLFACSGTNDEVAYVWSAQSSG